MVAGVAPGVGPLPAGAQQREEVIAFDAAIEVLDGNRMVVTERIRVRALGNRIERGIFRDFPTTFPRPRGLGRIEAPFEVLAVTRNGEPEPWALERIGGEGGRGGVRVRIGDAATRLERGVHDYTLRYETARWMAFDDAGTTLYWNVTGNGWDFRIAEATATVTFPRPLAEPPAALGAWTGPEGSTASDATVEWDPARGAVRVATTRALRAGEGLTLRVTVPPGIVEPADAEQEAAWFREDWARPIEAGGVVLLVVILYLAMWVAVGRDPPGGPLVVRYEPPRGYSPAALGYLRERGWAPRLLSATLVNLAVHGLVTIRHDDDTWTLRRTEKKPDGTLHKEERRLLDALFRDGATRVVLSSTPARRVRDGATALRTTLTARFEREYLHRNRGWFAAGLLASIAGLAVIALRDPYPLSSVAWFLMFWLGLWTIGTGTLVTRVVGLWRAVFRREAGARVGEAGAMSLFAIPFVVAWVVVFAILLTMVPLVMVVAAGLLGAVNIAFYHLLERPTPRARRVLDALDGFERFLVATDADRFDRLNPPARTPELFERYLPHAIALGVENRWAASFEAALAEGQQAATAGGARSRPVRTAPTPAWYTGAAVGGLAGIATSLGHGFSTSLSAASTPPPPSGSGGFGGGGGSGGSSGGGGGGGGGGGW